MSRAQSGQDRSVESHVVQRMIRQGLIWLRIAFDTFDQLGNGTVDVREVGTIIRSIGIYPSLEQLHQWVTQVMMIHKDGDRRTNRIYSMGQFPSRCH
jgi:Ca2+-binding EF-hand superfamily protein